MKDYYEILGLKKGASDDEIKKAYKNLVKKWHPDRWVNGTDEEKKTAETKIKEINEANDVLSDPEKRKNYDMFGNPDGGGEWGGFGQGFNPFSDDFDPFEGHFGRRGRHIEKGQDVAVDVDITMSESYVGVKNKEIRVHKTVKCTHCNGTGSEDGKTHPCPHCHGTGQFTKSERRGNMFMQQTTVCPYCHGTGKEVTNECKHCHGTGLSPVEENVRIEVPAGIFEGAQMRIDGMGCEPHSPNGLNGDLYVTFHVKNEPYFTRDGDNLVYNLDLTLLEAWDGCEKAVTIVDGTKVKVKVPKGSRDGDTITVRGKGFTVLQKRFPYQPDRGDLIVNIKYKVPSKITKEQRKLIEQFYELAK